MQVAIAVARYSEQLCLLLRLSVCLCVWPCVL